MDKSTRQERERGGLREAGLSEFLRFRDRKGTEMQLEDLCREVRGQKGESSHMGEHIFRVPCQEIHIPLVSKDGPLFLGQQLA